MLGDGTESETQRGASPDLKGAQSHEEDTQMLFFLVGEFDLEMENLESFTEKTMFKMTEMN